MSLTAISSLESATRKFFMNLTYIMSRKKESKRFWTHEAEMSLTAISLFESVRAKLFMNSTHNTCKNLESNVFGLSRPK